MAGNTEEEEEEEMEVMISVQFHQHRYRFDSNLEDPHMRQMKRAWTLLENWRETFIAALRQLYKLTGRRTTTNFIIKLFKQCPRKKMGVR